MTSEEAHDFITNSIDTDVLLPPRSAEAVSFVGLPVSMLNKMRVTETGPRYVKLAAKTVDYWRSVLIGWLNCRLLFDVAVYNMVSALESLSWRNKGSVNLNQKPQRPMHYPTAQVIFHGSDGLLSSTYHFACRGGKRRAQGV